MSVKDKIPGFNQLVLPYHFGQAAVAGLKNGWPGKKLRVIGVTGTNGKTTTCFMIWKMLNHAGFKTGLMTTVAWGVPGLTKNSNGLIKQVEHMTTADSFTLNRRMKIIKDLGAEFLVLEVTSHALVQFRTLGIPIEIAVMTNVTHEHLDYHKTFENYVKAKTKLFSHAKYGIINVDDPSADKFISTIKASSHSFASTSHSDKRSTISTASRHTDQTVTNYITYSINSPADLKATSVDLSASGVNYTCNDIKIQTNLPGKFNVYNSLAAVAVGLRLGLSKSQISSGIAALKEVEGRMNRLSLGQNFEVIVDFAHTPDAFEKVFSSVNTSEKSSRIISLFGGAGRRDESTRAERGEIAGKYSNICIITEDNSRDEDPLAIMKQFKDGCIKAGMKESSIHLIKDRASAIKKAISLAKKGDIVLILGKGHEKTILRADGPHPFEDLKVTKKAIEDLLKK